MNSSKQNFLGDSSTSEKTQWHSHPTTADTEPVIWETSTPAQSSNLIEQYVDFHQGICRATNPHFIDEGYEPEEVDDEDDDGDDGEDEDVTDAGYGGHYMRCPWPEFEEVLELEHALEQMPPHRQKQFLFLHNITNSSSDDSNFNETETDSGEDWTSYPAPVDCDFYHFELLEIPVPLPTTTLDFYEEADVEIREVLTKPRLAFYAIPQSIKHLLCTHDNLMGFSDSITLERIVRRRSLADIIPMSSQGVRTFLPLEVDFSLTNVEQECITDVSSFIQTLAEKFHQRIGSFFNTTFQFSYTFDDGKYHLKYGIFEDCDHLSQKPSNMDYIELHVFSRYLPSTCFAELEWKGERSRKQRRDSTNKKGWKSFVTMAEIFDIIEYMLKGKYSWIQNNNRLLTYIRRGGSLKVAAKQYQLSVRKNQRRILSNVRKFIKNKELMSFGRTKKLGIEKDTELEFHFGLYEQIIGYYDNLGINFSSLEDKVYVIELKDFENVIRSILAKYVYERYDDIGNDCTFSYRV